MYSTDHIILHAAMSNAEQPNDFFPVPQRDNCLNYKQWLSKLLSPEDMKTNGICLVISREGGRQYVGKQTRDSWIACCILRYFKLGCCLICFSSTRIIVKLVTFWSTYGHCKELSY